MMEKCTLRFDPEPMLLLSVMETLTEHGGLLSELTFFNHVFHHRSETMVIL
jgi:hypothetical protein